MKNFVVTILCLLSLEAYSQNIWKFSHTFPGSDRHAGISFTAGQHGFVGTGYSSTNQTLNDIWEFDPATLTWTQKADFPISVYAATSFTIDDTVYVTNGWNAGGTANSFTYKYDAINDSWSQVASYPGTPAYTTVSFVINQKAYVGMGFSPVTNEIWEYDPASDTWTQKTNFPGTLRQNASAGVINNIAYVGCGGSGNNAYNDFYAYDALTDTWTTVAPLPANGRVGAMEFVLDNKLFLCGGFDLTNYLREVWAYDPFYNTWQQYPDYGGTERFQGNCFILGNSVYVGLGRAGNYYTDFWEYSPSGANLISGKSFRDYNANGVADSGDIGFNNFLVEVLPSGNIYSTDHEGNFDASADTGTYTVTPLSSTPYFTPVLTSNTVVFPFTGLTDTTSIFAYVPTGITEDLAIDATALTQFRPGFTGVINLAVANKGTNLVTQAVAEIKLPNTLTFQQLLPADSGTISLDTLTIFIDSLYPGEIRNYQVHTSISPFLTLNDTLNISGRILPVQTDADTVDNYIDLQIPVVGSFDPNDIAVSPEGDVKIADVLAGQWLTYTIRFQNTGTASAIFIRIADSIPQGLDLSTLQFISSSHSCQLELNGDRVVRYFFDNINLPDSTTDLIGSNGYVKFKMKVVSTLPVGTVIANQAGIYFDYNPPVITNTAITTITTNTALTETTFKQGFRVYPNPSKGTVQLELPGNYNPGKAELYSSSGIRYSVAIASDGTINLSAIPNGLYIISLKDQAGSSHMSKLMKL